jgi:hypothetical protein
MDDYLIFFPALLLLLAVALYVGTGLLWLADWSRLSFTGQKSREQALLSAHFPSSRRPAAVSFPLRAGQSRAAERVGAVL